MRRAGVRPHLRLGRGAICAARTGSTRGRWSARTGGLIDSNTATDGDQEIAFALILAAHAFARPELEARAGELLAAIRTHEAIEVPGGWFPAAGNWAVGERIVNLSYFIPYAYPDFARVDPGGRWDQVTTTGYGLLARVLQAPGVVLPPDFMVVTEDGAVAPLPASSKLSREFSFDAMRLYFRVALDCALYPRPQACDGPLRADALVEMLRRDGAVFTRYATSGRPLSDGRVAELLRRHPAAPHAAAARVRAPPARRQAVARRAGGDLGAARPLLRSELGLVRHRRRGGPARAGRSPALRAGGHRVAADPGGFLTDEGEPMVNDASNGTTAAAPPAGSEVASPGTTQPTQDAARSATRVPTILIIDDDPVITFLLRNVLEKAGYRCLVARDGENAWQVLSPDVSLVLLDIMMPGQNGPEILRRMRLDPMLADIPVIFVTGRTDAATRIQCLAMGAVGFVVKPFHAKDVLSQVGQALERSEFDEVSDDDQTDPLEAALEAEFAPASGLSGELTVTDLESMPVSQLLRSLLAERRGTRRSLASHRRLVSALFRLHQAMSEGESPRELAQSVVGLAQKALRANRAEIWVPKDGVLVRLAAVRGDAAERERDAAAPASPELTIALDGPEAAAQVWRDWLTVERDSADGEIEIHFPLTVGTERIGLMSLSFAAASRPSESLSSFFCAEVALALDSAIRLERAQSEALTDALTGVYNRRFLEARLAEELRRASSLGYPTSLLFMDIDNFKWVNDTLGHDVGDRLLRDVARVLASQLRAVDVVARFGGDEFVVILPESDRAGSLRVATRLQEALAASALDALPEDCSITLTIGAATSPEDGDRPSELLVSADSAMLRGKRAGRNRIEVFGHESGPVVPEAPRREETAVLRTLIAALEVRDRDTAKHSREVAALSARIARHMGCDAETVRICGQAGLLHDIGKLHTPLEILLKPGPLDEVERTVMNLHAEIGAELTAALAPVRHLAPAIRASQEFFDGKGYPDGIAGETIPLPARIVAVADAFHAMRNDRPYREALPEQVAIAELQRCSGTQFDPQVVAVLLALIAEDQHAHASSVPSAA